jgi:hypothetical protein
MYAHTWKGREQECLLRRCVDDSGGRRQPSARPPLYAYAAANVHVSTSNTWMFSCLQCVRALAHTCTHAQKHSRCLHYPHISASARAPPRPPPFLCRAPRQEVLDSVQRRGSDPCVEHHVICLRAWSGRVMATARHLPNDCKLRRHSAPFLL